MNNQHQVIRSLSLRTLANLFALWYFFWGGIEGLRILASDTQRLTIPLGLYIPFVNLHLDLSYPRAPTFLGFAAQVMFFILFCAATGWVSGVIIAFLYNLIAKHIGFQLRGTVDTEQPEG
jgi:hypothetical protein